MSAENTVPIYSYKQQFTIKNRDIDYFRIPVSYFISQGFSCSETSVEIMNGYIDNDILSDDGDEREALVFNLQVGSGKTDLIYKLVKKYIADGKIVIISSPFKKLVEKDYQSLREILDDSDTVYNYSLLDDKTPFVDVTRYKVHVMTINCLMSNPGEDAFEQAFVKKQYLKSIQEYVSLHNLNVVIVFDEIHESTHNFERLFLPSLAKWKNVIYKCLVSSATHSPATVSIIKYIAALTDKKLRIFFADRYKSPFQGDLHIHELAEPSLYNEFIISTIDSILKDRYDRSINLISGYKSYIDLIEDAVDKGKAEFGKHIAINYVTGRDNTHFESQLNNFGTTFKTGVNIDDPHSIFIIVLPLIEDYKTSPNYGIFSDGSVSVVQAVARVRKGGEVHIIMSQPKREMSEDDYYLFWQDAENSFARDVEFTPLDEQMSILQRLYSMRYIRFIHEIRWLNGSSETDISGLNIHYPTLEEYIIERGQILLPSRKEIWGKLLSPYVQWAAINNQFCNVTLQTYKSYSYIRIAHPFKSATLKDDILYIIRNTSGIDSLSELPLPEIYHNLKDSLRYTRNLDGRLDGSTITPQLVNYFYIDGGRQLSYKEFVSQVRVEKVLWEIAEQLSGMTLPPLADYLKNQIALCDSSSNATHVAYELLRDIRLDFIHFIDENSYTNQNEEKIIHVDLYRNLPDNFTTRVLETVHQLRMSDPLLAFPFKFFNGYSSVSVADAKKRVFNELCDVFINRTKTRRTLNGEKNKYYLLEQAWIR